MFDSTNNRTAPTEEIHIRYDLFPQLGVYVPFVDCPNCNFRNIIYSEKPAPKTRLSSRKCMNCENILICPKCKNGELEEAMQTERDKILFCVNEKCRLFFSVW